MTELNLEVLLRSLRPTLNAGVYVYACLESSQPVPKEAIATFQEREGTTVILEKLQAEALGLEFTFECAWITLEVNSALEAVGLTSAFSKALGDANISCNVIAAYHHDHLFVPIQDAQKALSVLEELSKGLPFSGI
jgi:uncharacterized protein